MALTDIYVPILPFVSPFLNGCPEPVQKQMIRAACRQFCLDTEIWRERVFKLSVEDQEEYDLLSNFHPADTDEDWEISDAELAAYVAAQDAGDTWPTGPNPIPDSYITNATTINDGTDTYVFEGTATAAPATWEAAAAQALYDVHILRAIQVTYDSDTNFLPERGVNAWSLSPQGVLDIGFAPTEDDKEINVDVVYSPNISAIIYPDWIMERHGDAISKLALHYLYKQPRRPWTDQRGASEQEAEYHRAMARVRNEVLTKRQGGNLVIQPRPFA